MNEFHQISDEIPQTLSLPDIVQWGRPRSENLDSSARGSYRKRLDFSSLDLHSPEQFDRASVRNEVNNDQTTTLLTNMMLYNIKAQFDIKNTV